jgi:hypothetical protein
MRSAPFIFLGLAIMFTLGSCIKPPEYSDVPFISMYEVNKTAFVEYDPDSLKVVIYFEDGDGDLGGADLDSLNMFWEDSRVPGFQIASKIPFIEMQGNHKAISGYIHVTRGISQCINPVEVDTFHYSIQIRDRAGNYSNIIRTPDLYLTCE